MAQTQNDWYPVVIDGKVGFIDRGGNEVIAPQFLPIADTAHFSEGLAPVVSTEGGGYIDISGRFVFDPQKTGGSREHSTTVSRECSFGARTAHETHQHSSIEVGL